MFAAQMNGLPIFFSRIFIFFWGALLGHRRGPGKSITLSSDRLALFKDIPKNPRAIVTTPSAFLTGREKCGLEFPQRCEFLTRPDGRVIRGHA